MIRYGRSAMYSYEPDGEHKSMFLIARADLPEGK